jgi:hypothetical protein
MQLVVRDQQFFAVGDGPHPQVHVVLHQALGLALELVEQFTADVSTAQQNDVDVGRMAEKSGVRGAGCGFGILAANHQGDGALGGALCDDFDVDPGG